MDLVQRDLISPRILRVLYTAVHERATLDGELPEDLLNNFEDGLNYLGFARDFQIINVDGHDADEPSFLVPEAELGIYLALFHVATSSQDL